MPHPRSILGSYLSTFECLGASLPTVLALHVLVLVIGSPSGYVSQVLRFSRLYAETLGVGFDPQDVDEPLNVLLGRPNSRAARSCTRCFAGRSLAYPLAPLIHRRSGHTLSILRIGILPEAMIGMTDRLLISLPCISPQVTKVTIERFHGVDTIPVDEILPRFRSLGGVVEIGVQGIHI